MVTVYSTPNCAQCRATTRKLDSMNVPYEKVDLHLNPEKADELRKMGFMSAPIVYANGEYWTGFRHDKLVNLKA